MAWNNDNPTAERAHEGVQPDDRSLLVRAGWKKLIIYAAIAVSGVTLLFMATGLLFGNAAGELVSLALLFVAVTVLGQPSTTRRTRGLAYWLLTAVLVCGVVVLYIGADQMVRFILSVGVFVSPEFLMSTGIFVATSGVLFLALDFLFFLWWAGCFRPSRLLEKKGWLKLVLFLLVGAVMLWVSITAYNNLPSLPYYGADAIGSLLMYTALFLPWVLILGSGCLRLEDEVGLAYVRPKELGIATGVIAVLALGVGALLAITVPFFSATAWTDNFSLIVALGDRATELSYPYQSTLTERNDYLASSSSMAIGYALDAFIRSGIGILIFFAFGIVSWLILSLQRRTLKSSPKVKVLLRLVLAAVLCFLLCEGASIMIFQLYTPTTQGISASQLYEIVSIAVTTLAFAAMVLVASYAAMPPTKDQPLEPGEALGDG